MKINIRIVTSMFLATPDIGANISFVQPDTHLLIYPESFHAGSIVTYLNKHLAISHIKDIRAFNRKFIIINKLLKEIEQR